jgi:large subunit ribosomal protein L10
LEVRSVPSQEKKDRVKQIKKWFEKSDSLLVLRYKGLNVTEANELRIQVKGMNSELRVLKNTLTRIALEDTPNQDLVPMLDGPVAVVFVHQDPVPVAKTLREFSKGRKDFYLLGGMLDGHLLSGKEVEAYAVLPSREVLLAQALGTAAAPLSAFVSVLAGPIRKLIGLMQALADRAPETAEEAPAAPATEPEAPSEHGEAAEAAGEKSADEAPKEEEAAAEPEAEGEEEPPAGEPAGDEEGTT